MLDGKCRQCPAQERLLAVLLRSALQVTEIYEVLVSTSESFADVPDLNGIQCLSSL